MHYSPRENSIINSIITDYPVNNYKNKTSSIKNIRKLR